MTNIPDLIDILSAAGIGFCLSALAGVMIFNLVIWVA